LFNYGRNGSAELSDFECGLFWIDKYHLDGLRVDAVCVHALSRLLAAAGRMDSKSLRRPRKTLEAIGFLKHLNEVLHTTHPGRSDGLPKNPRRGPRCLVCRGLFYLGGLGFDLKWNMGLG